MHIGPAGVRRCARWEPVVSVTPARWRLTRTTCHSHNVVGRRREPNCPSSGATLDICAWRSKAAPCSQSSLSSRSRSGRRCRSRCHARYGEHNHEDCGLSLSAMQIVGGWMGTCAFVSHGQFECFGYNPGGQQGDGPR